jgi:hypothetical protein
VTRAAWLSIVLAALAGGCFRLSDPFYAAQDIHAREPSEAGKSLIFGTIVVDQFMAGDLDAVNLAKVGPGTEQGYRGTNRINLFRAFLPRAMKDGNFIIEVESGIYELDNFVTSGFMQPRTWTAQDDARRGTRIVVTRPGIYDLGTLRVALGPRFTSGYTIERITDPNPERQAVLRTAITGTRWANVPMAPMTADAPLSSR